MMLQLTLWSRGEESQRTTVILFLWGWYEPQMHKTWVRTLPLPMTSVCISKTEESLHLEVKV